jgi:hypothetical protein
MQHVAAQMLQGELALNFTPSLDRMFALLSHRLTWRISRSQNEETLTYTDHFREALQLPLMNKVW